MNQSFVRFLAVIMFSIALSSGLLAQGNSNKNANGNGTGNARPFAAPEIDLAAGATAVALLTGGLLVLRGRRRS